jgi:hypothetical protein
MLMPDRKKTQDRYQVDSADVFLSVGIGEGQVGTTDVFVGATAILRATGPIGTLRIGPGPVIKGKRLLVRSLVSDVSTRTNNMSVTYRLDGGKSTKNLVVKGKVDKEGKAIVFDTTFALA